MVATAMEVVWLERRRSSSVPVATSAARSKLSFEAESFFVA